MKKWLLTIVFGSALVLGACGGDDDGADEPVDDNGDTDTEESADDNGDGGSVDVAAAEEAFQQSCASCHGADLTGGAGPDLTDAGSNYSSDEIADIIENGKGSMPAGTATGDDVDLLANWLAEME
ncbi:cytochrome c551 [Virgibacillus oceani]